MLIHLINTPSGYYVYDAHVNTIAPISKNAYAYLKTLIEQKKTTNLVSSSTLREVDELRQDGLLSDHVIIKLEHPLTDLVSDLLNRSISNLTLQLTQNCNFRCGYCPYTDNDGKQRLHSSKKMTIEQARKALLFFHSHSIDSEFISITFYGGEPLLEYPLIKEVVKEAEELFSGKDILFSITTNGSLLSDGVANFFLEHDFRILISLDGPKEANDKNRKFATGNASVFDTVMNNLKLISNSSPKLMNNISINMVMDPSLDFDIFESLPIITELSQINIQTTLINDYGLANENVFEKHFTTKYFYHNFLFYLAIMKRYTGGNILTNTLNGEWENSKKIDKNSPSPIACPSGPCLPGHHKLFVSVDGVFYPCEKVNESEAFKCGSIDTGFNEDKVTNMLNVSQLTKEECSNCWAYRLCSSCVEFADGGECLSSTVRLDYCAKSKEQAHYTLVNHILDSDITNHLLKGDCFNE